MTARDHPGRWRELLAMTRLLAAALAVLLLAVHHVTGRDGALILVTVAWCAGIPARELFDAIRAVAAGRRLLPQPSAELMEAVAARVDPLDLPIIRLLLEGEDAAAVGEALQLEPADLSARIDALIARLKVEVAGR